eukprot:s868_g1.t1
MDIISQELRFRVAFAPRDRYDLDRVLLHLGLSTLNIDANKIVFPTAWEIGRRGTPPVSHISDYWVPWDEVLDSMVEYHLFVADVAVMEHVSEIARASGNYLQLCQEPCFWEECQVTIHHVSGVQIAEALSNASQRVRMLENRVAALEAEASERYSIFQKSSMPPGAPSRLDIFFLGLGSCRNLNSRHWVPITENRKMTHLISEVSFYKLHVVLDIMKLPVDLMDTEINKASWIPPEANLIVVWWNQSSTLSGVTQQLLSENGMHLSGSIPWSLLWEFSEYSPTTSSFGFSLGENNFESCTMHCRAGESGIFTDQMAEGELFNSSSI